MVRGEIKDLCVVVLNWNGGDMVMACLASVDRQELELDLVVVDNGSTDGSADAIAAKYPDIQMVRLPRNVGYTAGMNAGIRATSGAYVCLLNLDVELEPGYLRECLKALRSDARCGAVTGKLLKTAARPRRLIDTTGHIVYRNRRAVDRGEWEEDAGQYDHDLALASVSGAAPVYRREMLESVREGQEYLDEDFFSYFEDFDLSWRGKLKGWNFSYVPTAEGWHHRGGTGAKASTFVLACNHRNRLLTMLKNDHPASFLRSFPEIVYTELRATLHMLWLRPSALVVAWSHLLRLLPRTLSKRRRIQRGRTASWAQLEPMFTRYRYGVRATLGRRQQRLGR